MFPTDVEALTVAWLNGVLSDGSAAVIDFQAEKLGEQGRTSVVYVLTLTYDRATALPTKVVAKFSAGEQYVKNAVQALNVFEREVLFYRHFGDQAGIPVPHCYAAEYSREENACVLLLELVVNARQPDLFHGTVAEVALAVEHLAPFHARWWGRRELPGDVPCDYDRPELYVADVTKALNKIPEEHRDNVGRTVIEVLELWLQHHRQLAAYCRTLPLTLCHGSFHRQQLLFPTAENDPFRVIDWQSTGMDCGPIDLARLIVTGLLPDDRKKHEAPLVARYHALLCEHGVTDVSLAQVWEMYQLGIVRILVLHIHVFAHFSVKLMIEHWRKVAEERSLWKILFQWPQQALLEHDVPALLRRLASQASVPAAGGPS
ncbi:oxidoreductase family protein [Acanthopleuribacter pedis]|uniref:DUF1679 domain-containing protein n=1 Tax=Acanthopleuribacter pedis TaxID=442870 RepID=A0A8J7U5G4_9BACT|nr:DUF1679 domain-containing protein [Acanthopleuribacter pedis]